MAVPSVTRLIVVTDPGRDIDDALALLVLLGDGNVQLRRDADAASRSIASVQIAGIITSGGNETARAHLVDGILRGLGLTAEDMPPVVAGPTVDGVGRPECFIPPSWEPPAAGPGTDTDRLDGELHPATRLLLSVLSSNPENVVIACIAPLTPLAFALRECPRLKELLPRVRRMLVQGQVNVAVKTCDGDSNALFRLQASDEAFNFREDMGSAQLVLDVVQDSVPIVLLGKHTAYAVPLFRSHVDDFDSAMGCSTSMSNGRLRLSLRELACGTMNVFRRGNPTLFYTLYPDVLPQNRESNDDDWFDDLAVVSHPYDPLLLLTLLDPDLFGPWNVVSVGSVTHRWIGDRCDNAGVPDVARVQAALASRMVAAAAFQK